MNVWCFRKNIKYLRTQKSLTQKEFADLIGVSENTVYNWEREENSDVRYAPSLKAMLKIREEYDVSLDDLFFTDLWNNDA